MTQRFVLDAAYRGRVGFYGGTFDPVHNAHLYVAELAKAACQLDDLVLMPTALPPHKDNAGRTPPECRYDMVALAIEGHEGYALTDVELNARRPTYTADTLAQLHERLPHAQALVYIMGADSLLDLHQWVRPEQILKLAHLAVVYRPGTDLEQLERVAQAYRQTQGAAITLIGCEGLDISSSQVRERLAKGEPIRGLVPPAVADYIQAKGLYRMEE